MGTKGFELVKTFEGTREIITRRGADFAARNSLRKNFDNLKFLDGKANTTMDNIHNNDSTDKLYGDGGHGNLSKNKSVTGRDGPNFGRGHLQKYPNGFLSTPNGICPNKNLSKTSAFTEPNCYLNHTSDLMLGNPPSSGELQGQNQISSHSGGTGFYDEKLTFKTNTTDEYTEIKMQPNKVFGESTNFEVDH